MCTEKVGHFREKERETEKERQRERERENAKNQQVKVRENCHNYLHNWSWHFKHMIKSSSNYEALQYRRFYASPKSQAVQEKRKFINLLQTILSFGPDQTKKQFLSQSVSWPNQGNLNLRLKHFYQMEMELFIFRISLHSIALFEMTSPKLARFSFQHYCIYQ